MGLETHTYISSSSILPVSESTSAALQPLESHEVIQSADVIVVGGRIAGSIAAYNLARHGRKVICFDTQNILEETYPSCFGCGGLKQARTVELLNSIGITLPEKIIRQRLDGYIVHLPRGDILDIKVPGMLAVYRGFGPATGDNKQQGLDAFLMEQAKLAGVTFINAAVTGIDLCGKDGQAKVTTFESEYTAPFVIGAYGHNPDMEKAIKVPEGQQLDSPQTQRSSVHEFIVPDEFYQKNYSTKAHVVVVPMNNKEKLNVWFAAFIPKGNRCVSMILMGKSDVAPADINSFMSSPYVHGLLPEDMLGENQLWKKKPNHGGCCQCACIVNTITTKSPEHVLVSGTGGKFVEIGDAGRTRLFKDGIGAAVDNAILVTDAWLSGNLKSYIDLADTYYPADDDKAAGVLMKANDFAIRNPFFRWAMVFANHHHIPSVTEFMDDHARHMLTADIPYDNILHILPPLVSRALELAFPL